MNGQLALMIVEAAQTGGYDQCGIIGVSEVGGYAQQLQRRRLDFPQAEKMLGRLADFAEPARPVPLGQINSCLRPGHERL